MRRATIGLLAATSLLVLAGCDTVPDGADEAQALACPPGEPGCDEIRPVGPGGDLEVDMGDFFFDNMDGTPVTGAIEVTVHNVGNTYHNIEFLGAAETSEFMGGSDGDAVAGSNPGETDVGVVELFPGEWTIICNVPGHQASGMEAQVTVYASEEEAEAAEDDPDDELDPAA